VNTLRVHKSIFPKIFCGPIILSRSCIGNNFIHFDKLLLLSTFNLFRYLRRGKPCGSSQCCLLLTQMAFFLLLSLKDSVMLADALADADGGQRLTVFRLAWLVCGSILTC
jgi:hypothetical protein